MIISQGVAILELTIQGYGLNPTLVWDPEKAILIDAGGAGKVKAGFRLQ